jgi:hypothetical protein
MQMYRYTVIDQNYCNDEMNAKKWDSAIIDGFLYGENFVVRLCFC